MVTLENHTKRRIILEKAKELKSAETVTVEEGKILEFTKIFIKKDQNPSVRKEWGRLHTVVKEEKEKAENAGCTITMDPRKREILKDGVVIDKWRMTFL